jgi:polyketide synthase 12
LHSATLDLSAFVLFSSIAGTLGTPGQANYAAASTALDALACQRAIAGLPATSIAWGYWKQRSGLTSHLNHVDRNRLRRQGISPLSTDDALALLDQALATPLPTVVAAALDPGDIRRDNGAISPMLASPASASRRHTTNASIPNPATVLTPTVLTPTVLTTLNPAQQRRYLRDLVRTHLATVLALTDPGEIEPSTPFKDLGIDSLTTVELRNRIARATGFHLTEAALFDHSSLDALTQHLHTLLPPATGDTPNDRPGTPGIAPPSQDTSDYESISDEELFAHLDSRLDSNSASGRVDI